MSLKRLILFASIWLAASSAQGQAPLGDFPEFDVFGLDDLTDNWVGQRQRWDDSGAKLNFDGVYTLQSVPVGGFTGPLFPKFSTEGDIGNTFNGDLRGVFDTEKLWGWKGGTVRATLQSRSGKSAVQRAGSVAAVNNDAVFPNVESNFDGSVTAITELTYRHALTERVGVYGGLLNTSLGDENAIAGSALSHQHFLNLAMLFSLVENATVPHVSPGVGLDFAPAENVTGAILVFGSTETAGQPPFRQWQGTTLSTEWTFAHTLSDRPGAQTFGFLYGIDVLNTNIAADPRLVIISIILDTPIPPIVSDTWSFYYNAHQFIRGDRNGGWGVFARWGISDGNPNFVKQTAVLGIGGVGLLPQRKQDRWGVGTYLVDLSNTDLLADLNITDEVGGEMYYNIAVSRALHITLDAQVMDSGLPHVDTTWVLGVRTHLSF
jgi:porin